MSHFALTRFSILPCMPDLNTRPTLILRIRDHSDAIAWGEFVEAYTPLIYNFCLARGLAPTDASDVCQDVMRSVSIAIKGFDYDPTRGTFRSWLYTVTRNQLNKFFRSAKRRPTPSGGATVADIADARAPQDDESKRWEIDYRRQLFSWAAGAVRDEFKPPIWAAFWNTAVLDEDPASVGVALDMSRAAVYMAKSRVVARIREKISSAAGECWEQDIADEKSG